jgi:outer membrane receptor protein involved in Fe transport
MRPVTLATLLLLGPIEAAHAEDSGDDVAADDLFSMSLEDLLDVEVVTGAAQAHSSAWAPSNVQVITREMIQRRGYMHLGELLDDIPGIDMLQHASVEWDQILTVRGQDGNSKLMILLDGVRISDSAGTPHSISRSFSLANAERVEVLLGPASAIYGADAFSGVVNIVTRGAGLVQGGELTGSYGFWNSTADSLVAGWREGAFGLVATGSFFRGDGPYYPDRYPEEYAWYTERYLTEGELRSSVWSDPSDTVFMDSIEPWGTPILAYFGSAVLEIGDDVRVGWVRHSDTHSSALGVRPEFGIYSDEARWSYTIQSFFAQHGHVSPDGHFELLGNHALQTYEVNPASRYLNTYSGFGAFGGYKYQRHLAGRLEERLVWHITDTSTLSAGVSYDDIEGQPKSADLLAPYDPSMPSDLQEYYYPGTDVTDLHGEHLGVPVTFYHYRYQNFGSFLEFDHRPTEWLTFVMGARYDYNTQWSGKNPWYESISPRATLVFQPLEHTRVRAMYGEAFLAPSPYQTYTHFGSYYAVTNDDGEITGLASGYMYVPNVELQPERLRTAELTLSQSFGELAHVDLAGYHTQVRDLQHWGSVDEDSFGGWHVATVQQTINKGEAQYHGGTAQARGMVDLGPFTLHPTVGYAYTGGWVDDDPGDDVDPSPLYYVATHVVKGGLDLGVQRFSASLRAIHRGESRHPSQVDEDGDPEVIDGSTVLHAHLRYAELLRWRRLGLSPWVTVRNVLDARYHHPNNGGDTFPGSPQDPLWVLGGVDLAF